MICSGYNIGEYFRGMPLLYNGQQITQASTSGVPHGFNALPEDLSPRLCSTLSPTPCQVYMYGIRPFKEE